LGVALRQIDWHSVLFNASFSPRTCAREAQANINELTIGAVAYASGAQVRGLNDAVNKAGVWFNSLIFACASGAQVRWLNDAVNEAGVWFNSLIFACASDAQVRGLNNGFM
jgi:penicillin V acylase-like amidase (Ntn superfamily)